MFPREDYSIAQFGALSFFNGWGIFGGNTELNAQTDLRYGLLKLVDQCKQYSSSNLATTIKISQIQNPSFVRETAPFKIYLYDENG